jgi:diadenosine tetraphosphatase ApaH/serine/threonine PP2A family protein phosphatase
VPLPSLKDIRTICRRAKETLRKENSLLENITGKVIVVGDLHCNIDDLLHIIYHHGLPEENLKYLFLGDYVDRGDNSIETMLYLLCLKIQFPDYVYLIRGNHEFVEMCSYYGFSEECIDRLGMSVGTAVFTEITSVFPYLPLAAVIQNEYFAVHGGISSHINKLEDIRNVNRFSIVDYHESSVVTDLVWGDPRKFRNETIMTRPSERGIGEVFSEAKVKKFLKDNKLVSIFRAHEVCEEGYNDVFVDSVTQIPICITVFSATNYCQMNNKGAVLVLFEDGAMSIYQYSADCNSESEDESADHSLLDSLADIGDELLSF